MRAGIALGSNIEPRLLYLQAARRRLLELHSDDSQPVLCSRVYETSPVDCPEGSAPFLNAVLEISTSRTPEALLADLKRIEEELGRPAEHGYHTPRTIDVDLLYCDDLTLRIPDLELPHPRVSERRFVLQPLADIRPALVLPNQTKTIAALLAGLDSDEDLHVYSNSIY